MAQLEVRVADNFRLAGGFLASVQKGSSFRFEHAPVSDGLWLPTGSEANMQARILFVKNLRERLTQRDYGFQRFSVEAARTASPAQTSAGE